MDRVRILVVDDEAAATRMVRKSLERSGRFEVREENHARRAVETAAAFAPKVILLDILMPEMDGDEVAAELAKHLHTQHIPIVFMSALVPTGEFKNVEPHPGPYLTKPIEPEKLVETIDSVLAARPS